MLLDLLIPASNQWSVAGDNRTQIAEITRVGLINLPAGGQLLLLPFDDDGGRNCPGEYVLERRRGEKIFKGRDLRHRDTDAQAVLELRVDGYWLRCEWSRPCALGWSADGSPDRENGTWELTLREKNEGSWHPA